MKKTFLKCINPLVDALIKDLFSQKYHMNPYLHVTAAQKITIKNIIEAELRAESGKPVERPYGSNKNYSPWDSLLLNPRQLFEFPTPFLKDIETSVVIGKKAKKPLKLSMPIMIAGMSYGGSISLETHIALARASKMAGIATNMGESTLVKEIKTEALYVIGQLNRAHLLKETDFTNLDAIEIQLGQGAWGGAVESITPASEIDYRLRKEWGLKKGESKTFRSRINGINNKEDLIQLVQQLKEKVDVPIGIKIAASHFIEKELEIIISTQCDYIVIDGAEGGTAVAPTTLADHMGLPTLYALIRTIDYLNKKKVRTDFDVIITGGLSNPGHFLKAKALGADAIAIGSIALFALVHNQALKSEPGLPPTELFLQKGKLTHLLDVNQAAESLYHFLISCKEEMKMALQGMAKKTIMDLNREDLVSLDKNISDYTNIDYVLPK